MSVTVKSETVTRHIGTKALAGTTTVEIFDDETKFASAVHSTTWEAGEESGLPSVKVMVAEALDKKRREYQQVVYGCARQGWITRQDQYLYTEKDLREAVLNGLGKYLNLHQVPSSAGVSVDGMVEVVVSHLRSYYKQQPQHPDLIDDLSKIPHE